MNPNLEFDLRDAAKALSAAYAELRAYKHTTTRGEKLRPMKPTFGPGTPAPDHDWSFNIEHLLTHPRTDDDREQEAPVGLHEMVIDAQRHIHNRTIQTCDGYRLSMFIAQHAWDIADKFPAADDLLDLMRAQEHYIARALGRRYPQERKQSQVEQRQNSTVICKMMGQLGHTITPELLRKWVERGKITSATVDGRNMYLMSEVLREHRRQD
ncbi:hypothetical protein M3G47_01320 [Corynebacterium sanguinis]|uniref:hypothetical protein n=1 Tax=Corynebacterium sanguinis TaxID=2594913 RepID=UPI0021A4A901|nr:hypothetical protein [Corynebacterium sanguinis]MCT1491341.1 hypothetical protein [Corynebacterium sanguinis]MCT2246740.1 hypothetical protein [Corynebacterium sanguinis]